MVQPTLYLKLEDYIHPTHWRWVLANSDGGVLGRWDVNLDPTTPEYSGLIDPASYLSHDQPDYPPDRQLADLGEWIAAKIFGNLRDTLREHCRRPAVGVHVVVPKTAQELIWYPLELARFDDGKSFREEGVRFAYQIVETDEIPPLEYKEPIGEELRILAVFSLPAHANALNLYRERYELEKQVNILRVKQRLYLDIIHYGDTRNALIGALEKYEGWDIIHLSVHGERGTLLLENEYGDGVTIHAYELAELLELARARLKLVILSACYSGAGLAQVLAQRLGCAVLAMRYLVDDAFAIKLTVSLYEKLLDRHQPLPAALHLALNEALDTDISKPPLSSVTPILIGARAVDLQLVPPKRQWKPADVEVEMPSPRDLFPTRPEYFRSRRKSIQQACRALAPSSPKRGVLFWGKPGVGKTACALVLGHCYAQKRFQDYVWYEVKAEISKAGNQLRNLFRHIEDLLQMKKRRLSESLEDREQFRTIALRRWRRLLQNRTILLVLDNLDPLLEADGNWLDDLWADFVNQLLTHDGMSRVVLTARRVPADLANCSQLQVEYIPPLEDYWSRRLARDLPNLNLLRKDEHGLDLLQRTLNVAQGNPELLYRADKCACDRKELDRRVAEAEKKLKAGADELEAFPDIDGLPD